MNKQNSLLFIFAVFFSVISAPAISSKITVSGGPKYQNFEWSEPAGLSSPNGDDIVIDGTLNGGEIRIGYNWSKQNRRRIELVASKLDGGMEYDGYTTCDGVGCGTAIKHSTDNEQRSIALFYQPAGKLQSKAAPKNLRYNFGLQYWDWNSVFNNAVGQEMKRSYTSIKAGVSYKTKAQRSLINYRWFARAGYALNSSIEFNTSEYGYREDVEFHPGSMSGKVGFGIALNTKLAPLYLDLAYDYRSNQQTSETITTNSGKEQRFVEPKDTTQTLSMTAGFHF